MITLLVVHNQVIHSLYCIRKQSVSQTDTFAAMCITSCCECNLTVACKLSGISVALLTFTGIITFNEIKMYHVCYLFRLIPVHRGSKTHKRLSIRMCWTKYSITAMNYIDELIKSKSLVSKQFIHFLWRIRWKYNYKMSKLKTVVLNSP